MNLFLAVVAFAAFGLSVVALGLAVSVMRQSGALATTLQRHRLGHQKRDGRPDPAPHTERRQRDVGPPEGTQERRAPYSRLRHDEEPPTEAVPAVGPSTSQIRAQLPRPGQIGQQR